MLFYFTILKHHFINIPYHFTILLHRKTLFLLKYYFLTHSLLFLPNRSASFSWAFQQPIFIPPSQHWFNTQHTPIIHRSTYPNPSPHPHKQTQTSNTNIKPATKPHTNTTQQQSQATHTNTNPFKNQATDQKLRPGH